MKKFFCIWWGHYGPGQHLFCTEDWFTTDKGYEQLHINTIKVLAEGETYEPDLQHVVMRLPDDFAEYSGPDAWPMPAIRKNPNL